MGDGPFDWINSIIVFQYITPKLGYPLFEALLTRLAIGGVMCVHVTLYRDANFIPQTIFGLMEAVWDGETLRALDRAPAEPSALSMYDYDLNRLIAIAVRCGADQFFLEHTNHGGCHGVRIYARRVV